MTSGVGNEDECGLGAGDGGRAKQRIGHRSASGAGECPLRRCAALAIDLEGGQLGAVGHARSRPNGLADEHKAILQQRWSLAQLAVSKPVALRRAGGAVELNQRVGEFRDVDETRLVNHRADNDTEARIRMAHSDLPDDGRGDRIDGAPVGPHPGRGPWGDSRDQSRPRPLCAADGGLVGRSLSGRAAQSGHCRV